MNEEFNLSQYMGEGIEKMVKNVLKSSVKNPKESAFLIKYMLQVKKSKSKRDLLEIEGEHIPPFLMASIATNCNLYCKGCYARANKTCGENLKDSELSKESWKRIFNEARDLGISFVLLLGGEPLMRKEINECY